MLSTAAFVIFETLSCLVLFSNPIEMLNAAERGLRFGRDILPIFSDNCFECHGPDEKGREAELRLDTREGLTYRFQGRDYRLTDLAGNVV